MLDLDAHPPRRLTRERLHPLLQNMSNSIASYHCGTSHSHQTCRPVCIHELHEARTSTNILCLTSTYSARFAAGVSESRAVSPQTTPRLLLVSDLTVVWQILCDAWLPCSVETVGFYHSFFSHYRATHAVICESVRLKFHIVSVAKSTWNRWEPSEARGPIRSKLFSRSERLVVHETCLVS